ncbi:hypothetical protein FIBSPDRAFT_900885 [Athelia psychrophila]|uniref:Uncharacterized protein n=1 Tax=Athelia psychrophila TaxID=1759441 RepID=A0A165XUJ0_9AGAM|nr:hypothetical protein FIBSPDRAFT_900885 [Fibularhizoctonia sp. CBS 109695]
MISATSFDIQVLDELDKDSASSPEGQYFVEVQVDGGEVIQSGDAQRVPVPRWKVERQLGRSPLSKKHSVAKYTGQGNDLLANGDEDYGHIESADKKAPRILIKLDLVSEDHAQFMKNVDEDALRLHSIKGLDGAQTMTGILEAFGVVLKNIVPIIDNFAGSHPVLNAAWILLSSAYKVRG